MLNWILKMFFHALVVRPLVFLIVGLSVRDREKLPRVGPAIIVSNHNSHLDAVTLLSLFPLMDLRYVRPVAAADYFMKPGFMRWFSLNIIGIVPVDRHARERGEDPFVYVNDELEQNHILIIFPEGTRGEPERMADLKKGISHLIEQHPDVPITPIITRGLGKALPRGSYLPVPFFADVFVGDAIRWTGDRDTFMDVLKTSMQTLSDKADAKPFE